MKKFLLGLALLLIPSLVLAQNDDVENYRGTVTVGAKQGTTAVLMGALPTRTLTVTDNDAQNNTLTVAELVGGITVHTSVTGGGTVTTDTASNIIAGSSGAGALTKNNQCYTHFYINDGSQTLTFAGGSGVTVSDTGQTVATNESAILLVCRASSTTVTVHILGA